MSSSANDSDAGVDVVLEGGEEVQRRVVGRELDGPIDGGTGALVIAAGEQHLALREGALRGRIVRVLACALPDGLELRDRVGVADRRGGRAAPRTGEHGARERDEERECADRDVRDALHRAPPTTMR